MTANFAHTLSYELSLPRSLHHRYELRNFSFLQTYYVLQLRLILRGRVTGFHYVSMYADFSAPPAPFVCKFTQPRLKHYVRIWAYTSPSARTYVVNGSPIQLGDKCRGTGCVYSAPREQTENTTRDLRGSRVDAAKIDLLAVQCYSASPGPMLQMFFFGACYRLEGWFWFPFCPRPALYSEENSIAT